jgi:hypothetical protein
MKWPMVAFLGCVVLVVLFIALQEALPVLQQAAAIIAAKNLDGHISEASIRRLIIETGRLHRFSAT